MRAICSAARSACSAATPGAGCSHPRSTASISAACAPLPSAPRGPAGSSDQVAHVAKAQQQHLVLHLASLSEQRCRFGVAECIGEDCVFNEHPPHGRGHCADAWRDVRAVARAGCKPWQRSQIISSEHALDSLQQSKSSIRASGATERLKWSFCPQKPRFLARCNHMRVQARIGRALKPRRAQPHLGGSIWPPDFCSSPLLPFRPEGPARAAVAPQTPGACMHALPAALRRAATRGGPRRERCGAPALPCDRCCGGRLHCCCCCCCCVVRVWASHTLMPPASSLLAAGKLQFCSRRGARPSTCGVACPPHLPACLLLRLSC